MEIVATFVPGARGHADEVSAPPAGATMIELRADLLGAGADLAALVARSTLPVIVTLRSRAEGGEGPDRPAERRRFFERAAALTAAFFDLEAARDLELAGTVIPRERTILSAHFTGGLPGDLEERAAAMLAAGTRFVKVVPAAARISDVRAVLHLAQALDRGSRRDRRAVVFASGEAGRATRLLGPLLGAPLAYAAWAPGRHGAAGQYTPGDLAALVGHLGGRPRRVFAVLGSPVGASLSPRMHAAAYAALGLPHVFVPLEVHDPAELDELLVPAGESWLDDLGLPPGGFAVTMPWKGEAARRCTLLAPRAERAGAANTVLPRGDKVLGDCTDIDGITRALVDEGVQLAGVRALVLGAGGAARAAAVALQLAGAGVTIAARDRGRAEDTARKIGAAAGELDASEVVSVAVNATPAGADGASSPWLERLRLPEGAVVVDLPYGDTPTFLEQLARRRGWHYVGGRSVLLYQAVAQFAAMTGAPPPVRAMAAAIGLDDEDA
ncbi:MAG TPA: type I 3-dehydroquinate dehydratase [Thermoanaerobaculaceae bacterium]|nr:type I 3-dehydroquinate dehydratase [Thermoanaerobaculaceae bacterium]